MRIPQVLALGLCLLGASALPAPGDTQGITRRDDPSPGASLAVVPSEKAYQEPPERGLSLSRKDEKSTDISARQNPTRLTPTRTDFKQWGFMGIKTFLAANAAVKFYSLQKDCKEFGEDTGSAFICIWNSIATIIGMGVLLHQANEVRGHLGTRLRDNGWHVPGITKREEVAELSGLLSDDGDLSKRDDNGEVIPRHVFGTNLAGQDVHFAYVRAENNASHFRLGYGPGPETENNRLHSRAIKVGYNRNYFDKGGLDFTLDESVDTTDDEYLDPFDGKIFTWMVDQIGCYLQKFSFLQGLAMNANGLYFQVYDAKEHKTATRGSIAPYTENQKSVINQMPLDWTAGIESDDTCTNGVQNQGL